MPEKNQTANQRRRGFTLIELMIVIAIIGLLAAIALPNFISYRNKAFCGRAETDANTIANEIGAYFAIPSHSAIDKQSLPSAGLISNDWDILTTDPNFRITITVKDDSGRCPADYQRVMPGWTGNVFTKLMHI